MNSDQIFSDIQTPDFMLAEINRLLGEDVLHVEPYTASGPMERDDSLFALMNETQEEYEAAQRAALGMERSQFDIDPYATSPTYDILNHSVEDDQYSSSLQQNFGSGDFDDSTEPLGGFTNPYAQHFGSFNYSDAFDVALNTGGSAEAATSLVYTQGGGEIGESSTNGDVPDASSEDNRGEDLSTRPSGNALPSTLYVPHSVAAEESLLDNANHADAALSNNIDTAVGGPQSIEGDERDVSSASSADLPVRGIQPEKERLMGGSFHFDFQFDFPYNVEEDRKVGSSDIAPTSDVSNPVTNEGTATKTTLNGSGSDDAEDVAQEANYTSNDHNDNKENEADDAIHPVGTSPDFEATVPLESSSVANVRASKGKQPEKEEAHVEEHYPVIGANDDELKSAAGLPIGSGAETSKPTIPPTEGMTNPAKRKATTTVDASAAAKIVGTSKAKQPPKKKVRIAKDGVPAAQSSGILTCDECLKSPVHDDVPTFNRKADLNRHIRTVHELLEQLTCPNAACVGATFSKRSALNRHKRHFGH